MLCPHVLCRRLRSSWDTCHRERARFQSTRSACSGHGSIDLDQISRPTVFVVDDDVSVRESLEALICHQGWRPETCASAREFLSRPRAAGPCCLILDVSLPDLSGLDLQVRLNSISSLMPIIFITGFGDVPMTVQAMKAGAVEFLTKPFSDDVLLAAVREALEMSHDLLAKSEHVRSIRDCYSALSRREREVMNLVVSGMMNKQVANMLGISEVTVKAHRGRMMQKMRARSLAELVTISSVLEASDLPYAEPR